MVHIQLLKKTFILFFTIFLPFQSFSFTLGAVGDIMFHRRQKLYAAQKSKQYAYQGYTLFFRKIKNLIQSVDFAFANLESPIAPEKGRVNTLIKKWAPVFNTPLAALGAIQDAGFDWLSVANNHSMDMRRPGLTETIQNIKKNGMLPLGYSEQKKGFGYKIIEKDGKRILLTAFAKAINCASYVYKQRYRAKRGAFLNILSTWASKKKLYYLRARYIASEIKKIRKTQNIDLVILSIHWGKEYQIRPLNEDKKLSRLFFENGADVILGHHPHVLGPLEFYQARDGRLGLVVYSLGNFISDMASTYHTGKKVSAGDKRDSIFLKIRFNGPISKKFWAYCKKKGLNWKKSLIRDVSVVALWNVNQPRKKDNYILPIVNGHEKANLSSYQKRLLKVRHKRIFSIFPPGLAEKQNVESKLVKK